MTYKTSLFFVTDVAAQKKDKCTFSEYVLVLDESDSIGDSDWRIVLEFAEQIVRKVGISANGNRAAVASFSRHGRSRIKCNEYTSTNSLANAILKLDKVDEYTNLEDGLIKGKNF